MDIATTMSVVQTLLAALQCPQLISFCSKKTLSSQLDHLRDTVRRIQAVLEDAESKQVLSKHDEVYFDELNDAVYEADDLFDEFVTLAHQKKLNDGIMDSLSSLITKLKTHYRISHKVEKIKEKLDEIASRNQLVLFKHDPEPIKKRSRETCSYVHAVDIIGRDDDLEKIVAMLLQSHGKRAVSFLSIVGIGGLGKTALAQLVFNDPRLKTAFSLKMWTCVSDEDDFDEKEILRKILEAATNNKHHDATKDQLQKQLRQLLDGKKYLLVLDDVWTENRDRWCQMVDFLMGGQKGSWILVTTRSKQTAIIVGDGLIYELKGLSKDNSWRLFERVAFDPELSGLPEELVNIGQKIVERCASVPLAIRVAGSLLYGQDKRKWLSFQELPLTKFENKKSDIMPILKLSYHQLESPLKSCFGYCALFPKDYVMEKKTLLRLWMAQGYIPSGDQRSMVDVAEEYFLVLLRRSFFQDVREDGYGNTYSCKMHDLMHDVAQEVVQKQICTKDYDFDVVDKRIRHISTKRKEYHNHTFSKTRVRSYLRVCSYYRGGKMDQLSIDAILANWKYLRVLDLSYLDIKSLPSTIGELLHLRYLNLSSNRELEILPSQLTKLYNLETLLLNCCECLKELPKEMRRLTKLRVLDIGSCDKLRFMPSGMRNLNCLEELSMFVVAEANFSAMKDTSGLEELKALTELKGKIQIKIRICKKDGKEGGREGGCLSNKPRLTCLGLEFSKEKSEGRVENDEEIIEDLQPHSNIKELNICYYEGVRMSKWVSEDTLANLVHVSFSKCHNLESLVWLGSLHYLKSICLIKLSNLEWLFENVKNTREEINKKGDYATQGRVRLNRTHEEFSIFPSLESLMLFFLPKLKGCRAGDNHRFLFPKLKTLDVRFCKILTGTLECPALKCLDLYKFNKNLRINSIEREKIETIGKEGIDKVYKVGESTSTPNIRKLRNIRTKVDNFRWLNWQHIEVESLQIFCDPEVVSLEEVAFCSYSSSLQSLCINSCLNLRNIFRGLEYLTTLNKLSIILCPNLKLEEEEEWQKMDVGRSGSGPTSWSYSLHTLKLWKLPQLINLPSWMQLLTNLQTLEIIDCKNLKSLPSWMPNISSLRELKLEGCSACLKERCEQPTGEYLPYIQHISSITITCT